MFRNEPPDMAGCRVEDFGESWNIKEMGKLMS
jgi:hypothetical protein